MLSTILPTCVTFLALVKTVTALPYPFGTTQDGITNVAIRQVDVVQELGPQLSNNATIYTASDSRWVNATARWSSFRQPTFVVVVEPGIEVDVAKIVSISIPSIQN